MKIHTATEADKAFVLSINTHIDAKGFFKLVHTQSCYVLWENEARVGLLTHCVLWEQIPLLTLLFVKEDCRGHGYAKQAILDWETEMQKLGFPMTLVSTRADEDAQHLYRKLGYVDCGGLVLANTPFDQPTELFLRKVLRRKLQLQREFYR